MKTTRTLAALTAVILTAASAPALATQSVAHRGDKQYHSDNSIPGIQSAIDKGADWVEIDVHYNIDGDTFFLAHDNLCSGNGLALIDTAKVETVRSRCALPELDDVLSAFEDQGYVTFIVELKTTVNTTKPGSHSLVDLLEDMGLDDDVYVSSLTDGALTTIRNDTTTLKLMRVRATTGSIKVTRNYIDATASMRMNAINVNLWAWSPELVSYAKSRGLVTSGWAWPTAHEGTNADAVALELDMWMTDRLDDLISRTR